MTEIRLFLNGLLQYEVLKENINIGTLENCLASISANFEIDMDRVKEKMEEVLNRSLTLSEVETMCNNFTFTCWTADSFGYIEKIINHHGWREFSTTTIAQQIVNKVAAMGES